MKRSGFSTNGLRHVAGAQVKPQLAGDVQPFLKAFRVAPVRAEDAGAIDLLRKAFDRFSERLINCLIESHHVCQVVQVGIGLSRAP